MMSNKTVLGIQIAVVSLLITPAVQAHTIGSEETSWFAGLVHPLLGLDHLLVMVAMGLWASQQPKYLWQLPGVFLSMMLFGSILGDLGCSLPLVEAGIASSVMVMGILLMFAIQLPIMPSVLVVGLFATYHGYAHGVEIPQTSGLVDHAIGFMLSTAALQGVGIGSGLLARHMHSEKLLRIGGVAIGLTGAWLLV